MAMAINPPLKSMAFWAIRMSIFVPFSKNPYDFSRYFISANSASDPKTNSPIIPL